MDNHVALNSFYGKDCKEDDAFKDAMSVMQITTISVAEADFVTSLKVLTSKNVKSIQTLLGDIEKKLISAKCKTDDIQPAIWREAQRIKKA